MELQQLDLVKKYVNLFVSGHKLIVGCILAAVFAALYFYISTPEIYQSSASIVYQEQQVNPSRFSPHQEMDVREMLNTVSQQVMSRTNLEGMIKDFNLYSGMRAEAPIEDVIARMRERDITVEREGGGNVFSVSYQGRDPETVQKVTNALAAKFIEENLRVRQERANETAAYIQDELRMSRETLHEKEKEMRDYKLKHYNEMPDQRESNMTRLNALQEQLQAVQSNIQNLEQTRLLVSEQLETLKNIESQARAAGGGEAEVAPEGAAAELAEARSRLQEMRSRYTDAHPGVKRMEKRVRQLESEVAAGGAPDTEGAPPDRVAMADRESRAMRIQELTYQLKEIEMDLKAQRQESRNIRSQMKQYQEWIDAAPVREAEWAELTRDYDELKEYHDELVSRSLAAEAAQSLEIRQKGSQFQVVDSAFLPKTPLKGTFLKMLLLAVAGGLAVGAGILAGLDLTDTSFKSVRDIENTLGMTVSCAMPQVLTEPEQRRGRLITLMWYAFFVCCLIAWLAATVYFWRQGDILL